MRGMSGIRRLGFVASVAAMLCAVAAGREWTDDTGQHRTEAEFVDLHEQTVRLKKPDGSIVRLPLNRLSRADQEHIRRLVAKSTEPNSESAGSFEDDILPLLQSHCMRCHGSNKSEAEIDFSRIAGGREAREALTLWRKAAERIERGEMPPEDSPPLAAADREKLLRWMNAALRVRDTARRDPGPALQRRLSRAEYELTIRDLVGIEFDAAKAVGMADESQGHGFANRADVLELSPALMEKYFAAADQVLDVVFGPAELANPSETLGEVIAPARGEGTIEPPEGRSPTSEAAQAKLAVQYRWAGTDEKESQLRPHFQIVNGGTQAVPLRELSIRYWFTAEGPTDAFQHWCDYAKIDANNVVRQVHSLPEAVSKADAFLEIRFTNGSVAAGDATGEIQIRVAKPDWAPFSQADDYSFAADVKQFTDAPLVTLYRDGELVWGTEPGEPRATTEPNSAPAEPETSETPQPTVTGPVRAELRALVLNEHIESASSPRDAARAVVEPFARRAWRRPVHEAELETLLAIFDRARAKGSDFPNAVRPMLKAVLVSPLFLLRIEDDRPATGGERHRRVNDHELAARLSYFLWSSLLDDELTAAAERGALADPAELERQTRRMLADPKARALTDNFGIPWLQLGNLAAARPTQEFYPSFSPSLKESMFQEALLFLENMRLEDRSVLELIDSDYTFVNEELARHYALGGVSGPQMRRVALRPGDHRGGVLDMGSVLAVTSHTYRTSPTMRGKYVLEVLLGAPPPPPPANAGALKEEAAGQPAKTFRESLERHASVPACAACHSRIDPLGFGLENFDGTGKWRESEGELLDASGELPSGEKFTGPEELKELLFSRQDQFLRNLSEQMLTYALGRRLEDCDQPSVLEIQTAVRQDPRFSTLVVSVVKSFPFQHRRNAPEE